MPGRILALSPVFFPTPEAVEAETEAEASLLGPVAALGPAEEASLSITSNRCTYRPGTPFQAVRTRLGWEEDGPTDLAVDLLDLSLRPDEDARVEDALAACLLGAVVLVPLRQVMNSCRDSDLELFGQSLQSNLERRWEC